MLKDLQKRFESTESYISLALGLAVVLVIGVLIYNFVSSRRPQTVTDAGTGEQKEQKAVDGLPGTHTVNGGETLWSISEKYYKTGYNWGDIAKANNLPNADLIEAGQSLVIPVVTPIMPQGQIMTTSTTLPKQKTYTVVRGDTLWKIAIAMYNDGYKWVEIAQSNKLMQPNLIHPGNVLTLP